MEAATPVPNRAGQGIKPITLIKKGTPVNTAVPPVILTPLRLYSLVQLRPFLKKAEVFLAGLKQHPAYPADEDLKALGAELAALVQACRDKLPEVTPAQREAVRQKIVEIEGFKAFVDENHQKNVPSNIQNTY